MARRWLLTQNRDLRPHGIWNWTLPAFVVRTLDGRLVNVCPQAGECARLCYARNGTYLFPNVRARHLANLALSESDEFVAAMVDEVGHRRYTDAAIRIHDSGDFYSEDYARKWCQIVEAHPGEATPDRVVRGRFFYAYTKEVRLWKRLYAEGAVPPNLVIIYSLGGRQDRLVDLDVDRHAEVFPDLDAVEAAGYVSQDGCDLIAAVAESNRIGIPANNIAAYRRRQGAATFGGLQRARWDRVAGRSERPDRRGSDAG